jgi:choice-of-anchor C domain-containing protein
VGRFPLASSVLVALVLGCPAGVAADPILINGSFELGPLVGRGIEDFDIFAGETDIVGWTVLGGGVDYMNAPWDVADGIHAVDLDLRNSNGGIEQAFATVAGQQYRVSFQLSGNPGRSGGSLPVVKQVRVSVDGFSRDYAHDSTGQRIDLLVWDWHEFLFVASGTSATLRFTSLTPFPNSFGAMIDDVRVSAVPEPGALMLLAPGLFGLALRNRARRRSRKRIAEGSQGPKPSQRIGSKVW